MPKDTFFNLIEEKQEKVMRAAIGEFLNHGYEKANIGIIAKNAAVAKGSMYQYFENKKELFLYAVQWSIKLLTEKYSKYMTYDTKEVNIFDYLYQNSEQMITQMREERELVIFIQEVMLGKYSSLTDESMGYMMKYVEENTLQLIRQGKKNGHIRKDIDDNILAIFITGASLKFKDYIMRRAKAFGEDIIDEDFNVYKEELKSLIELLKNGIGNKCQERLEINYSRANYNARDLNNIGSIGSDNS